VASRETDRQKQARQACDAFIARTTVLVSPRRDLKGCVGSAVLLRNARGVPFLVTASHLFRDDGWRQVGWRPLALFAPALEADGVAELRDVGADARFAPGRVPEKPVDVALVTVRPEFHDRLRPLAAGMERIADDDAVRPEDVLLLAGFPMSLSYRQSPKTQRFATLTYATGITGRDQHGRLEVYYDEAIPHEGIPTLPHLPDVLPGKVMSLGHPGGISGGGLWRVRGSEKGEALWSPSSHATLIGVPVAWNGRTTEYAESVAVWGRWLKDAADRLT
jgi:hypothetical protein